MKIGKYWLVPVGVVTVMKYVVPAADGADTVIVEDVITGLYAGTAAPVGAPLFSGVNETVAVVRNPVPRIVTTVPAEPDVGEMDEQIGINGV